MLRTNIIEMSLFPSPHKRNQNGRKKDQVGKSGRNQGKGGKPSQRLCAIKSAETEDDKPGNKHH